MFQFHVNETKIFFGKIILLPFAFVVIELMAISHAKMPAAQLKNAPNMEIIDDYI